MTRVSLSWLGSFTVHAGLLACLDVVLSQPTMQIDFVRGRATIELQASLAAAPPPEPEDAPIPKIEQPKPVQKEKQLELQPTETIVERRAPEVPEIAEAKPTDPKPIEIALVVPATTKQESSEEVAKAEVEPPKRKKSETKIEVMEAPTESVNSIASMALEGTDYDEPPQPSPRNHLPEYPPEAYRRLQVGTVKLRLWVDAEGFVQDAQVVQSCPIQGMDESAVEAALRWRFTPARRAGENVFAVFEVRVNFNFNSRS